MQNAIAHDLLGVGSSYFTQIMKDYKILNVHPLLGHRLSYSAPFDSDLGPRLMSRDSRSGAGMTADD